LYEETEKEIHEITRATWGGMKQHFNRCSLHPLFATPGEERICPYRSLLGEHALELVCDLCGESFEMLKLSDPRVPDLLANPEQEHFCFKCQKSPPIDRVRQITVLSGQDKVAKLPPKR
jgi:hypothetical protein